MNKTTTKPRILALGVLVLFLVGCGRTPDCSGNPDLTRETLLECVTAAGAREHLLALQAIADENGGNRAAGTPGYEASVAYVTQILQAAGYDVIHDPFEFEYEEPQSLRLDGPDEQLLVSGKVQGSGRGQVTGSVCAIDPAPDRRQGADESQTAVRGCEIEDFGLCDLGGSEDIVLIKGGGCYSSVKAANAQEAGAEALIILVQGGVLIDEHLVIDRVSLLPDATPSGVTIPVVVIGQGSDSILAEPGRRVTVNVPQPRLLKETNVLAELPGADGRNVVMAGAHLDSAPQGPGISDNGSGSAALLETAVQMAGMRPRNTVRFAWWGAEETGLNGSRAYVDSLTDAEREAILMYLNVDMIASPNHVNLIYDGDRSDNPNMEPGPAGSADIEALFASFYTGRGLPFESSMLGRGSDFVPFEAAGIPAGMLFSGAEELKTAEQAARYGGQAGEPFDPCYHQPCDTVDNIDMDVLDANSDALAYALYHGATEPLP